MLLKSIRRFLWIILAGAAACAGTGLLIGVVAAQPSDPGLERGGSATLTFQGPEETPIYVGTDLTVTVFLSDVVDLYGAQLELGFDAAVLQVLDDNDGLPGVQIRPGACPVPNFVLQNTADNGSGAIDYSVTQLNPTPPVSGDCAVAFIHFEALTMTTATTLTFDAVTLSDQNGTSIPVTTVDSQLEILPLPPDVDFIASPLSGTAPLTVTFTNLSSGVIDSCDWDFGDGSGSNDCSDQIHIYQNPGSYTVSLEVSGPGGTNTMVGVNIIQVTAVLDDSFIYMPAVFR